MTKYYCCFKCNKVESYAIDESSGDTTFSRGEYLTHNEYVVTGFKTRKEAETCLKDDPYKIRTCCKI